jgi:hypothetical protein
MYRKVCEKTIYDVLRYKVNKREMLRYEGEKGKNPYYNARYLPWIKYQVQQIEVFGLDKWLQSDEVLDKTNNPNIWKT